MESEPLSKAEDNPNKHQEAIQDLQIIVLANQNILRNLDESIDALEVKINKLQSTIQTLTQQENSRYEECIHCSIQ